MKSGSRNRDISFGTEHEDQVLVATTSEQTVTWATPVTSFSIYNASGQVCIYEPVGLDDDAVAALDADSFRIPNTVIRDEPIACTDVVIKLASGTGNVYLRGWR